jgi:hypothetical protein
VSVRYREDESTWLDVGCSLPAGAFLCNLSLLFYALPNV